MAQPYVGEIRMFAGTSTPSGWMSCEGQLVPIAENVTLFNLIGTTYGGDGESTFALPDLRGRAPMHFGGSYQQGATAGAESVILTGPQMPSHTHAVAIAGPGTEVSPIGNYLAESYSVTPYINTNPTSIMNQSSVNAVGSPAAHENMQPFICLTYMISLFGIYPSQPG